MLKILHKVLASFLAFVILFSTLSFSVQKHICMGEVTDVSFFREADNCEMMVEKCDAGDLVPSKIQEKNCCENVLEFIPGNENEQQALSNFEIEQVKFVLTYAYTYQNLLEERNNIIPFIDCSPPLVDKDINVLYQTFLI